MSDCGDSQSEMFRRPAIDDDTIEAILAGDSQAADGLLVSFAEDVRLAGTTTVPEPSTALAAVLAEGCSPDKGDLPVRTRRLKSATVLQGVAGRVAALGVAAKVGLGLGIAVTGVTAAGAVGVLPDAASDAARNAVEAVTPFEFPDEADDNADFGEGVSTDATDEEPGVDGPSVASEAQDQGGGAGAAGDVEAGDVPEDPASAGLDQADETPAEPHTPDSVPGDPDTADENRPVEVPASPPDVDADTGGPPEDTPPADRP